MPSRGHYFHRIGSAKLIKGCTKILSVEVHATKQLYYTIYHLQFNVVDLRPLNLPIEGVGGWNIEIYFLSQRH